EEFLKEALALWGQREKIRLLRADSGFFDDKLLSFLEQRLLPYIVVARLTPWVKRAAQRVAQWTMLDDDYAVLEFRIQLHGWIADLSPAGYPPDSGPHLRGNSWADRPPTGDSSVGKLGRTEDENSLARQHLELANPNFAEVGSGAHNLIPNRSPNNFPNPRT